jgi:hypothetical protein
MSEISYDIDDDTQPASSINPNKPPLPKEFKEIDAIIKSHFVNNNYKHFESFNDGGSKPVGEAFKIEVFLKSINQLICKTVIDDNSVNSIMIKSVFDSLNKTLDILKHSNVRVASDDILPIIIGYALNCYKEFSLKNNTKIYD